MFRIIVTLVLATSLLSPAYAERLRLVVADAQQAVDPISALPVVSIRLNADSARDFAMFTTVNVQTTVDFLIDDEVVLSPFIQTPLTGGLLQVRGFDTAAEASAMAKKLRSGDAHLSVSPEEDHVRTIDKDTSD